MSKRDYAKMTVAELLALFEETSLAGYELMSKLDVTAANRMSDVNVAISDELRSRGRAAVSALMPFLDHGNPGVRCDAAVHILDVDPDRAIAVLEAIERDYVGSHVAADAGGALFAWRSGDWRLPKIQG